MSTLRRWLLLFVSTVVLAACAAAPPPAPPPSPADTTPKGGFAMDGRNRVVMSANRGGTPKRHILYALSGEGPSFVSRRLHRDKGVLASKPWSNELKVFLPIRNVKTAAVSIVTLDNTVEGSAVDVAKCF